MIRKIDNPMTIGPMDGCIDELRISAIARYTTNFTPATEPFTPDEHTAALFHFDENDDGWLRGEQ